MQALQAVTLAHRAETLHSAPSLQRTAEVEAVLAQVLEQRALAVAEVASGQKVQLPVQHRSSGQAVAEMALASWAATRLAVLVAALGQTLMHLHRLLYTRATVALEAEAEAALMRRTLQQVQQELAALAIWKRQVLQQVMAV